MYKDLVIKAADILGYSGLGSWDDKYKCLTDDEGWFFDPIADSADALDLLLRTETSLVFDGKYIIIGKISYSKEYLTKGDYEKNFRIAIVEAVVQSRA
jgi:hypothetical protein